MTARAQLAFWAAVFFLLAAFIWLFQGILLPFVAGIAIAYFLDPVVDRLERKGMGRGMATAFVLFVFVLAFLAFLSFVLPVLFAQLVVFMGALPAYLQKAKIAVLPYLQQFLDHFGDADIEDLRSAAEQQGGKIFAVARDALFGVWNSGLAFFNMLSLLIVTPVVAFYLLRDWDVFVARIDSLLPGRSAPVARKLAREMNMTIAGFLRGQSMVCLLLGVMYAVGLSVIGLDFAVFIGLLAGVLSFIPYVGSLVGMVVALLVAFFQFGDWAHLLMVLAVFGAGQLVEGNYLTPRLVGEKVGLHAVWVLFALMAGGSLFGFVGVMLAVPVAAIIGVLVRHAIARYQESALYTATGQQGEGGEAAGSAPENSGWRGKSAKA